MKAFLFPGQGTQKVGMGVFLRERYPDLVGPLWREADEIVGFELTRACQDGPVGLLRQMPVTQPAVFMCSYAAFAAAGPPGPGPTWSVGTVWGSTRRSPPPGCWTGGRCCRSCVTGES